MFDDDDYSDLGVVDLEKSLPQKKDYSKLHVCFAYQSGTCLKGEMCPYKHTITNKSRVSDEVCKYWLRGLCKMGEDCEFLHEHVTSKIPECFFYQGFGECSNPECVFRHNSMDEGIPECQAFRRGFCKYGPKCRLKHIKLDACPNFMAGLCVDGPECRLGHPSTLYITDDCIRQRMTDRRAIEECGLRAIKFIQTQCGVCGTQGHSPMQCPQNTNKVAELKRELSKKYEEPSGIGCYHCRQEDHTSNECSRKRERYMQHRHPLEGDQTQLIPGVQGTRADLNQEGDRARPKCHRCGEEGHVLRDCPLAKAEQAQGKHAPGFKPPTCYHCGEVGHIATFCPQRQSDRGGGYGGTAVATGGANNVSYAYQGGPPGGNSGYRERTQM